MDYFFILLYRRKWFTGLFRVHTEVTVATRRRSRVVSWFGHKTSIRDSSTYTKGQYYFRNVFLVSIVVVRVYYVAYQIFINVTCYYSSL